MRERIPYYIQLEKEKEKKDYVPEKMQGPALELQEELVWFEVLHF